MCIDGHMVQALILAHETAKGLELGTYCVMALMPLRPLAIFGQEAKLEPPEIGLKGTCVGRDMAGSAWTDLRLPYYADLRQCLHRLSIFSIAGASQA